MRIGLAGLGRMGRHHARLLRQMEGVHLVGGFDPAGDRFGCLPDDLLFGSLEALLANELDALVIASPTSEHATMVRRAIASGLHVLVEKPVAATSAEAFALAKEARECGVLAVVGHVERFNPAIRAMREQLDHGDMGEMLAVSTLRVGPNVGDKTGGVAIDLATHDVDLIRYLTRAEFRRVGAEMLAGIGGQNDDLLVAIGRLENEVVYSLSANRLTPTKQRIVRVVCTRGLLVADTTTADLVCYRSADSPSAWDALSQLRGPSQGQVVQFAIRKYEPLEAELEGFRDAITTGDAQNVVSLEDGARALAVVEWMMRVSDR